MTGPGTLATMGARERTADPAAEEASLERVAAALECVECGLPIEARGLVLRCRQGHPGLVAGSLGIHHASDVVELRDERSARSLSLKIPKVGGRIETDERLLQETLNEATTLAHLNDAGFGAGPYRVPVAVAGAVRGEAILMETLAGRQLEALLLGSGTWTRPRTVLHGMERAGRWLGHFVRATEVERAGFDPLPARALGETFLSEIVEGGYPGPSAARLGDLLRSAGDRAAGEVLPRCLVHGDFRPRHVFLGRDDATVIDWEQTSVGWAHEDAAFFLASIDGFSNRHPLRRWSPGGRLAAGRFARAYLDEGAPAWGAAGRFLRLLGMIRALNIEYRGTLPARRPFVFERVVLPHYARWFRRWELGGA